MRFSVTSFALGALTVVPIFVLHASDWAGVSGTWNSTTSPGWTTGGIPNAVGAIANHGVSSTGTTTQNIAAGVTVGTISLTNNSNNNWTLTPSNTITLNQDGAGSGFATISNTNTSAMTSNYLSLGAGTVTLADDVLVTNTGASTSSSYGILLNSNIGGTGNMTLSNASTLVSTTNSIKIQGTNAFTGSVLVQKGTTAFNVSTPFGGSANALTLGQNGQGSAAIIASTTITPAVANNITVASGSGGTLIIGSISTSTSGGITYSGTVTLNGDLSITSANTGTGSVTFSNTISGSGSLTKIGTGIAALNKANTFLGTFTASQGTTALTADGALGGVSAVSVSNGAAVTSSIGFTNLIKDTAAVTVNGSMDVSGNVETIGSLAGTDTTATLAIGRGSGNSGSLIVGDSTSTSFVGTIQDGVSSTGTTTFTKQGDGVLTLSGANSYTGSTVVAGGTLKLDSAGTTTPRLAGSTSVTISTGGTLLLANSIPATGSANRINNNASVTLSGGGTVNTGGLSEGTAPSAPSGGTNGVAGMGALTLQSTSSASHATFDFMTGANGSSLVFDSLTGGGNAYVDVLNWTGLPGADTGGVGNDRLLFAVNPNLSTSDLANYAFYDDSGNAFATGGIILSYGNQFELVPVPEPTTILGGLLLVGAAVYRRRARLRGQRTAGRASAS